VFHACRILLISELLQQERRRAVAKIQRHMNMVVYPKQCECSRQRRVAGTAPAATTCTTDVLVYSFGARRRLGHDETNTTQQGR